MADCDLRGHNVAKKAKTRLPENEKEGLNVSSVLGNTRRAQKAADEGAEK